MRSSIEEWAASGRQSMVEMQLRRRGIRDARVLAAMSEIPRHAFVAPGDLDRAYEDHPIAIGYGQTISQPYMVALMIEALELNGSENVLEVGTGSGYQAAILARLAARVCTVERNSELAGIAEARLAQMGFANRVEVVVADGSAGYPPEAPYDGIIVAAGAPEVPSSLIEQLAESARLIIPVGSLDHQELRQLRKIAGKMVSRVLGFCRFVPLTGGRGWHLEEP